MHLTALLFGAYVSKSAVSPKRKGHRLHDVLFSQLFSFAVHAERQRRYKQINLAAVPRDLIIKGQRGPGPIDHQFVTRFMLDMHGKLIFRNIILI